METKSISVNRLYMLNRNGQLKANTFFFQDCLDWTHYSVPWKPQQENLWSMDIDMLYMTQGSIIMAIVTTWLDKFIADSVSQKK